MEEYDAVIVGGSFAGLATASFIRSGKVLLLEKKREIGARQRSTCCTTVEGMKRLGCEGSILKTFDTITFHSGLGASASIGLPIPFCTIDYREFCRSMAGRLDRAEIVTDTTVLRVEGPGLKLVVCKNGIYSGKVIVDCSGWRAVTTNPPGSHKKVQLAGAIETETEYSGDTDSIHLYLGKKFVDGGYGWVFPTGEGRARIGVGGLHRFSMRKTLDKFLRVLGLEPNGSNIHCGYIPCFGLREPVVEGIFRVGDAGGQVLPLSAEGIRKCIHYAEICGSLITNVLDGEMDLRTAQEIYEVQVHKSREFYENLVFVQEIAYRAPDWAWDYTIRELSVAEERVPKELLGLYLGEGLTTSKYVLAKKLLSILLRSGIRNWRLDLPSGQVDRSPSRVWSEDGRSKCGVILRR
ncbi:MAG: NAD(P)/FAD-dependent oxidoreductase [Euryarchaeota archaeon]|nr:NAD(P)/FAD-dependent oxidoreductase [Euryarchaeota archaeon]